MCLSFLGQTMNILILMLSYPNVNWLLGFANRLHRGNSTWYSKDLSSSEIMTPKFPIEITNVELGRNCFLGSKDQFNIL